MDTAKALLLGALVASSWCRPAQAFTLGQLDVHGFISQGYLKTSHNNYLAKTEDGTTEFNEAAVNVSSELSDKLRVGIQILARDLGDDGNDQVKLDWGFADYRWRDELGVRIGKIKRPLGLYNEGRDVDMLRTSILLPQSIYHEELREVMNAAKGGGVYGTIPAGRLGGFDYQHVYGSSDVDLEPVNLRNQFAAVVPGVPPGTVSMDVRYTDTTTIVWRTPLKGLRLGVTYARSRYDVHAPAVPETATSDPAVTIPGQAARKARIDVASHVIASAEYRCQDLTLTAEYVEQDNEIDLFLTGYPKITYGTRGCYGGLDYRFTPWLAVGSSYSVYYPNRKDRHGHDLAARGLPDFKAWQKDACLTFRFDPVPGWVIKLEGHRINGAAQVFDYDDPRELEKVWNLFAAKITYNF